MNHRDRALAAMRGLPVDHIPFIARMNLWYRHHQNLGTLPRPYENASLYEMQRDLGIGIYGLGGSFFRLEYPQVQINPQTDGEISTTEITTPYGSIISRTRITRELKSSIEQAAQIEYPYKSVRDLDALLYFIEKTEVVETYSECASVVEQIGGDGLAHPHTGGWLPAHQLMIEFMGYETFYYELNDHPAAIELLIDALAQQHLEILNLAASSPASIINVGSNYDEQMTPPPIFERYFTRFYRNAKEILSRKDKILVVHGDGEMKTLLSCLMDCGVEVVEAVTPKPMTSIDVRKTRELWGNRVTMWGGIPSIILTPTFTDAEFKANIRDLFDAVSPGDRFILGFGDNVPTDALFHRILWLVDFYHEHGKYPIKVANQ